VLGEILSADRIKFLEGETKEAVLNELVSVVANAPEVGSKTELQEAIFKREELMSTGIGNGIAIPHVRLSSISDLVGSVGLSKKGIDDYQSFDDEPIRIVIMLVAGFDQHPKYLRALAAISKRLRNKDLREALLRTKTEIDAYHLIAE
jgi:PTS system nitrogen regulatory IIA component